MWNTSAWWWQGAAAPFNRPSVSSVVTDKQSSFNSTALCTYWVMDRNVCNPQRDAPTGSCRALMVGLYVKTAVSFPIILQVTTKTNPRQVEGNSEKKKKTIWKQKEGNDTRDKGICKVSKARYVIRPAYRFSAATERQLWQERKHFFFGKRHGESGLISPVQSQSCQ